MRVNAEYWGHRFNAKHTRQWRVLEPTIWSRYVRNGKVCKIGRKTCNTRHSLFSSLCSSIYCAYHTSQGTLCNLMRSRQVEKPVVPPTSVGGGVKIINGSLILVGSILCPTQWVYMYIQGALALTHHFQMMPTKMVGYKRT